MTALYAVQVDVSNPNLSEATGPKISSAQHAMSTLTPEEQNVGGGGVVDGHYPKIKTESV